MNTMTSAKGVPARTRIMQGLARHGEILIFLLFLVLCAVTEMLAPEFLSGRNIANVARQASALGIVSIGQTIAIISLGIDLSVSSVATMAGVIAATVMVGKTGMVIPATLLGLATGIVVGLANGLLIAKVKLPDFIVTLATFSAVDGLMLVYTQGRSVGSITPGFAFISEGNVGPVPTSVFVWLGFAAMAFVFLRYTRLGRHVFAVGGNREVARLSGVNVIWTKILVYVLSGFLAAAAGLMLLARMAVGYPLAGQAFQLDSIAASVVGGASLFGGRGGITGTIVGVLILSVLNNSFNLIGVSTFSQFVIKGFVIIAVVAIRARGETRK